MIFLKGVLLSVGMFAAWAGLGFLGFRFLVWAHKKGWM